MKAEDVDAELVEAVLRSRYPGGWDEFSDRSREYVRANEANQVRSDLAAVLPEIQAQAWKPVTEWANEWTQYLDGLGELTDFGKGMKAAVDQITRLHTARLTATTEEPK